MILRSLFSRTVRKSGQVADAAQKILDHQRDILPQKNVLEVEGGIAALQAARASGSNEEIELEVARLEETAHKWLKQYPNASWREHVEGLFTMAVLLFAFRQFFAQPMEIPTGSAQPTFWGVMADDLRDKPGEEVPSTFKAIWERCTKGYRYYHVVATADGSLVDYDREPKYSLTLGGIRLLKHQALYLAQVGTDGRPIDSTRVAYDVRFPPETFLQQLGLIEERTGQPKKVAFKAGEDIVKVRVKAGDRLFVDRLSYNFRRPRRGETIVFKSTGIPMITQGTHYIKRLIAMNGEKVKIGDDRHVYINGAKLDTNTPGFEHVYSFDPAKPPERDHFSGHVNQKTWIAAEGRPGAALFPDGNSEFTVRPNHFLCFGDNTMNSYDGRDWGDFPDNKVVGKSWFVFWPFTERWGWSRH
jgi:signal peptidase I